MKWYFQNHPGRSFPFSDIASFSLPSMFKRVEKRIKRKKHEDELGLDEDMKDVLGLNDTDSDESESDIDSEDADQDIEADDNSHDEMEGGFDQESDDDGGDDDQTERSLITVEEALKDPIFIVSLDPDIKECIVCPGKLLKTPVMVETHKSSNACTLSLPSRRFSYEPCPRHMNDASDNLQNSLKMLNQELEH